jgi:branched-chain amino acid transport system permease protein
MLGLTYSLIALGLTLIYSIMRIINFAHGQIYMLGAFAFYLFFTQLGLPFFFALLLGAIVIAAFGILLEKLLFRPLRGQDLSCLLLSLGIGFFLEAGTLLIFGEKDRGIVSPFSKTLKIGNLVMGMERVLVITISLAVIAGLFLFLQKTKTGRAIRAFAQDMDAALLQGVDVNRMSWVGFALGSGLAALAGGLMAPIYWVSPFIGGSAVINAFTVMVIGGLGSIPGTFLGGLILGALESLGRQFLPGSWSEAIAYSLVVFVLMVRPRGLMGYEE